MGSQKGAPEDILFREDTFTSMKFNMGVAAARPPVGTNLSYGDYLDEKRPLSGLSVSGLSVHPRTPETKTRPKAFQHHDVTDPRSPSPAFLEPDYMPTYVDPADSVGTRTPKVERPSSTARSHSPFSDRDSPLPPVGNSLYHGEYIGTPIPSVTTPHLPAPSPQPNRRN